MSRALAGYDVVVNCVLQDTEAPLMFVTVMVYVASSPATTSSGPLFETARSAKVCARREGVTASRAAGKRARSKFFKM